MSQSPPVSIRLRQFGRVAAALGSILLFAALLAIGGCVKDSPRTPVRVAAVAAFVDEAECAPCHPAISKSCSVANHIRTLRPATRSSLGALAPPAQEIKGSGYRVRAEGDRLLFGSTEGTREERSIDYALGSGKLGMTYVSLDDAGTLTELRMSWFPKRKAWYITPGQEPHADNKVGEHYDGKISRSCIQCHATALPASSIRPEPSFQGVGCQSCHGPASEHVASVKAGRFSDLRIERISTWSAAKVNDMCGTCHRRVSQIGAVGNEVTMTQRFQPYGIMRSPCYVQSGGQLSCLTCHDPHANVSRDRRHYEEACLRCHSPTPHAAAGPSSVAVNGKACPVNPRDGCIPCHMPKRKVFALSQIPIDMADHLIWAYRKKKP